MRDVSKFDVGGLLTIINRLREIRFGVTSDKTLVGSGPVQSTTTVDTMPTTTIPITSSAAFTSGTHGSSFFGWFGRPLQDVGHRSEQRVHVRKVCPPVFSCPSRHKLSSIQEHIGEDIQGIYKCNHSTSTTLCLEELVLPSSEPIPPKEVAPVIDDDADIWQQLNISDHYSNKETIMWNHLSNYVEIGNEYISLIHDKKWFRGWEGRPDGCCLKPITLAALNACVSIPDDHVKQIYVYLDGSSNTIDSEPVMSWGFCCFKVDKDLNHDLFFSFGGIMCTDKESEWYFGAETCNSFTAELQSNVMARLLASAKWHL